MGWKVRPPSVESSTVSAVTASTRSDPSAWMLAPRACGGSPDAALLAPGAAGVRAHRHRACGCHAGDGLVVGPVHQLQERRCLEGGLQLAPVSADRIGPDGLVASMTAPSGLAARAWGSTGGGQLPPAGPVLGHAQRCAVVTDHRGACGREGVEVGLALPGQRDPGRTPVGGLDQSDRLGQVHLGAGMSRGVEVIRPGDGEAREVDARPDPDRTAGVVPEQAVVRSEVHALVGGG